MDPNRLDIRTIFERSRQHCVPLFQRPYVWNEAKQWQPLWEDITYITDRILQGKDVHSHFLGAIVLEQVKTAYDHMERREVIDGQQRLITLQLLLKAFCDYCQAISSEKHHKTLVKLTRNDDPMIDAPDEQFKVWPTNIDRVHFRRVMEAASPEKLLISYGAKPDAVTVGHSLADGYLYFHRAISAWLQGGSDLDKRLDALVNAIRSQLRMIVIDLQSDDDPQLIFETLNARGTPLLASDLIKNLLFHRARMEKETLEPLYERTWKAFDDDGAYWSKKVGRGHAQRARIDVFLQHYLTGKLRDDVGILHLYTQFRTHVRTADTARQVLEDVRQNAAIYRSFDQMPEESRANLFFERLDLMDMTTAYPFLLTLYANRANSPTKVDAILVDMESFLVRRMVCQLNTRSYNKLFLDLIKKLDPELPDWHVVVRDFLLGGDTESTRWPTDDEFEQAWLAIPATKVFTQGRVRMILEALEHRLRTDKSEKISLKEKLTIEHLMPQSWDAYWPLTVPEGKSVGESRAARQDRVNSFGNLTLLTKKLNPAVSNGPWDKKQPKIAAHSALALNRALGDFEEWDELSIHKRGKVLFKLAVKVWPHPGP